MSTFPTYASADEAIVATYGALLKRGEKCDPRGLRTIEIAPYAFVLTNPRARCVTIPERRWSISLAIGEFCWHVSGSSELDSIAWYADRWHRFSENGKTIDGSCYGHRIFNRHQDRMSQWERVLETLRRDSMSRRAVLFLAGDPSALRGDALDFPCALTLQFVVRNGALDAIAALRSNDAHHGLPYDLFLFTMLQEMAALALNLPMGRYVHVANSMHIYDEHVEICEVLAASATPKAQSMPSMDSLMDLPTFLGVEVQLRTGRGRDIAPLSKYWRDLAEVLRWRSDAKLSTPGASLETPTNEFYSRLLKNGPLPRRTSFG